MFNQKNNTNLINTKNLSPFLNVKNNYKAI